MFFFVVIDPVIVQIDERLKNIPNIISKFKLMIDVKTIEKYELETLSKNFVQLYDEDVNEDLIQEIDLLRGLILIQKDLNCILDILPFILNNNYRELSPNVPTVFKLFFTLPVTIANAERSFSKLKLIKNYLQWSMSQEHLNALAILSIEKETSKSNNFSNMINELANQKSRI